MRRQFNFRGQDGSSICERLRGRSRRAPLGEPRHWPSGPPDHGLGLEWWGVVADRAVVLVPPLPCDHVRQPRGRSLEVAHVFVHDRGDGRRRGVGARLAGIASASLYGISLGGMVAQQQLALRHPRRVESLVLGATHPGGPRAVSPEAEVLDFFRRRPELPPEEAAWASVPYNYGPVCRRQHAARIAEDVVQRLQIHSQPTPIERSSVPLGSTTVLAACLAYRFRR